MANEQEAREKIEGALVARGNEVDGVICTGNTTTVAAVVLLGEHNRKPGAKPIRSSASASMLFVDIRRVTDAIRDGSVDMTLAQNPIGHGYISCALLDLMLHGWQPTTNYQFIDAGFLPVTKENVDSFQKEIEVKTKAIVAELKTKYLVEPK